MKQVEVSDEFVAEVKNLVVSVRGFLRNENGSDDYFVESMDGDILGVLQRARAALDRRR